MKLRNGKILKTDGWNELKKWKKRLSPMLPNLIKRGKLHSLQTLCANAILKAVKPKSLIPQFPSMARTEKYQRAGSRFVKYPYPADEDRKKIEKGLEGLPKNCLNQILFFLDLENSQGLEAVYTSYQLAPGVWFNSNYLDRNPWRVRRVYEMVISRYETGRQQIIRYFPPFRFIYIAQPNEEETVKAFNEKWDVLMYKKH